MAAKKTRTLGQTRTLIQKKRRKQSGQAMLELIPAITLFLIIITAALAFFRVMREATLRQEVVRNLTFAKMANMGTLTSPPNQIDAAGTTPKDLRLKGSDVITGAANTFISERDACFAVLPSNANTSIPVTGVYIIQKYLTPVDIQTFSIVHRQPNGRCQP